MTICGAEISGSKIVLVGVEVNDAGVYLTKNEACVRIDLGDSSNQNDVRGFLQSIKAFIENQHVNKIIVRGRAGKGKYAGGAAGFKIEGIIQTIEKCEVIIVDPKTIKSKKEKRKWRYPNSINEYQKKAFDAFMACEE